jgi:3,4-dihydroxy 2-butanone 4-phosphate synthase / GTP cyclohydrolase II
MPFVRTEDALSDLHQGKMIILCDDENRENEGDLCLAAEKVTPATITCMARYGPPCWSHKGR